MEGESEAAHIVITWSVNLNPNRLCPDLAVPRLEDAAGSAFRHLDELGAGAVRIDLFWHWLMPEPGRVNAEAVAWYKAFFAQADRRGVTLFPLLYHPPAWAMAQLATDEPAFLAAWTDFCRLVRREFGDAFPLVQVWNEPNNFLAALKQDPVLFHEKRIGPLNVPVGVRWETLAALFAIARAELAPGTLLVYNVLTNLSPFLPFKSAWLDWDVFTDRLLAIAGDHIDVIALDHYPDTWAPGTGPLEWECLEVAAKKVNTPGTPWYGKTVIIGEVGYSNAPNFHMVNGPVKLGRFFPDERCEDTQSRWYGAAMSHLRGRLTNEVFPHNRLQLVNVYELYDAPRPVGAHPVMALEDHFGLRRRNGSPKPAFQVLQGVIGGTLSVDVAEWPAPALPAYWKLARWGRDLHARLAGEPVATLAGEPLVLEAVVPALAHGSEETPTPSAPEGTTAR
jgi:hypothetical protein